MTAISEEEKLRRRRSVASNLGTHAMEGLEPDAATLALLNRYAEGELTLEQFGQAMDSHAHSLLAKHRSLAGAA